LYKNQNKTLHYFFDFTKFLTDFTNLLILQINSLIFLMFHDWILISSTTLILTALFCMGLMWVMRKESRPKLWLAVIFTVVFVYVVSIAVISSFQPDFLEKLMCSYSLLGIVIAGLMLVYCRSLMLPWESNRKIICGLLIGILAFIFLHIAVSVFCSPLPQLRTFDDIFENIAHPIVMLRIVAFWSYAAFWIFVCVKMFLMYFRHKICIAEQFSFREEISLSWLPCQIVSYMLYGLLSALDMLTVDINWLFVAANFIYAAFYLAMSFLGLRQQDIYTKTEVKHNTGMFGVTSKISAEMRSRLTRELTELMQQKREYRNPELRIDGVAQALNTNRTYLSTVIRENFENNFMGLVNKYRVEEAKELLSGDNSLSMVEISEQVGFKSISSFNSFFKKDMGVSPMLFRKKNLSL